jgi:hypothetical protein
MSRPTIARGDHGSFVAEVQTCLDTDIDGDFGAKTEQAVVDFQREQNLQADGIVGPQTWAMLEQIYHLPPYPPELLPPLDADKIDAIILIAENSEIARYYWQDRGRAPLAYTRGMAIAFSTVLRNLYRGNSSTLVMAQPNTHNASVDALSWYAGKFDDLGMDNSVLGVDTLRHLFALQMGLGMRESSGKYCCGRDMSASNVTADTAEAGLFQMSWNASAASEEMQKLMDQYSSCPEQQCAIDIFKHGVTCSSSDWQNYGSGAGAKYQSMAKNCPQFAVETASVGLRVIRQHWGPINRYEAELRPEADQLFAQVQEIVIGAIA